MEKQQLLALNARNLQFFAEGGEAGAPEGGGNDGGGIDPTEGNGAEGTNPTFEAPKTQSELDSIINKSNQKTLENYKKGEAQRIQDAIAEALKKEKDYSQLSEEERAKREFEDSKKAFEAEKSQFEHEKLVVQVQKDLVSKGLPSEFAELFALENAENSLKKVGEFEAVFNQAVAEAVKISLRQKTPGIGVGGVKQSNYGASLAQNANASGQKLF
ncbi:DUF4355 domain-containing protein [Streptococcus gallolyticus subsp. gallolyticus]|uniref:DUF4355 domain-containing protein n=1 Tax=Streptococcus gallolyticus TaxID=315405 RepID=UPI0022838D9C|nr:DUF4355 domain-containing protein [Streptococcus gallolyticus]MCY7157511.1 DUF4355 domain-containing protein [Streptococcus gallolyticus subsp. gallolyticus]